MTWLGKFKQRGRDGETKTFLYLLRVMLHQVVGVDSSVTFQTGESFNICSLVGHAEVSPDISSVLRFSVVGEDTHSFYSRDGSFRLELDEVGFS